MDFKRFFRLILVEQTLFALPFAWLGILFAGGASLWVWFWTTVALVAARTAGMSFNRVIDADLDGRNPRTSDRLLPRGEMKRSTVWTAGFLSSLALIGAAFMLNRLCFQLSFVAVLLLFTYSYMKRFSAACHFHLGLVEAAAPVGGYLAVTGAFSTTALLLGLAILAWIAGFDILYALLDIDFDRVAGLHSVPAWLGKETALKVSVGCYLGACGALVAAGVRSGMGSPYWLAAAGAGLILFVQQQLARQKPITPAMARVFRLNLWVAPLLFCGTAFAVFGR